MSEADRAEPLRGVLQLLGRAERDFPERIGVWRRTRSKQTETVRFRELASRARGMAASLSCRSGPVGILLDDGLEWTTAFLAAAAAHRPIVLLSADGAPLEQVRRLDELGVTELLSTSGRIRVIRQAWASAGLGRPLEARTVREVGARGESSAAAPPGNAAPPILLCAGRPVALDQPELVRQSLRQGRALGIGADSVILVLTGLSSRAGIQSVLQALSAGARLAFVESRRRDTALHAVEQSAATHVAADEDACAALAEQMDDRNGSLSPRQERFWRLVTKLLERASDVSPELVRRAARRAPTLRGGVSDTLRGVVLSAPPADPRYRRRLLAGGLTVCEAARPGAAP